MMWWFMDNDPFLCTLTYATGAGRAAVTNDHCRSQSQNFDRSRRAFDHGIPWFRAYVTFAPKLSTLVRPLFAIAASESTPPWPESILGHLTHSVTELRALEVSGAPSADRF